MMSRQRVWPILLVAALGVAVLCALGAWQVQRLQWKNGLLAQLSSKVAGAPVTIAEAENRISRGEDVEFLRVGATGRFEHRFAVKVMTTYAGGPGFAIVTPLILADGRAVFVDRGVVPESGLDELDKPEGSVSLSGIVRLHDSGPGYFDVRGEHSGLWYWWDVPAMQSGSNLPGAIIWVPFVIQLLPGENPATFPRPSEPRAGLSNNHLGYAITWFGMAAALLVMSSLFIRQQRKKPTA
jgi:surfeit locus 1 family protein